MIAESNEGSTLTSHLNDPFLRRVRWALKSDFEASLEIEKKKWKLLLKVTIAGRVLESLRTLNENKLNISIYLLDLSMENIAFNEQTQRVYFIDVENVLLVDQERM